MIISFIRPFDEVEIRKDKCSNTHIPKAYLSFPTTPVILIESEVVCQTSVVAGSDTEANQN